MTFLIISFLGSCRTEKTSIDLCQKAHTGQFINNIYNKTGVGHWTHIVLNIDRTDTIQIERMKSPLRSKRTYKINWLSACEYNRTILDLQDWGDSAIANMYPKGQKIIITKVTNDYVIEKYARGKSDTLWYQK